LTATLPLVVDLDGTLVRTDTLHESALRLLRDSPLDVLRLPFWLSQGKAVLKRRVSARTGFDPAVMPYREDLLAWLHEQRAAGRSLVLCTASDVSVAGPIAAHLGIFDHVMASDGVVNLAGRNKADALVARYGAAGFDYAGNSGADLEVWVHARRAIVVDAPERVAVRARQAYTVEREFPREPIGLRTWQRVLRVHQWMKNLLVFVPLFAAHAIDDANAWPKLMIAFLSFSLCASAVYIGNDLLDLESDRLHPRKRNRPFAAGAMPVWMGVIALPSLLSLSMLLGWQVGGMFLSWIVVYFLLTCVYTLFLKRLVLIDCLTLALLYTVRIVAGAAAAGLGLSFWLLAFSMFLFLSLAFIKRYAELQLQAGSGKDKAHGRGYFTADAPLVQAFGVASGYGSVVVLALYLNTESVILLYRWPEVAGGAVPILLFWISWVWLQAHRGDMNDDPLVFAVKDRASLAAGAAFAVVLLTASAGWSW
jgi:4-hydroxybenzoate polyprenyltransferase/beta-phosphoglucomutase-like phosphatase (HAD superfamily)